MKKMLGGLEMKKIINTQLNMQSEADVTVILASLIPNFSKKY